MIATKLFIGLAALLNVVPTATHKHVESPTQLAARGAQAVKVKRALQECGLRKTKRDDPGLLHRWRKRGEMIEAYVGSLQAEARMSLVPRDWIYEGGSNASCILTPEGEEGPYYVNGSLIRHDIRDGQEGIPLLLDVQLMDVTTCSPLAGVMLDFWNANSTGVYSNEESENTVGLTFNRGIRKSDEYGLVQVLTNVPGWYAGRAQHIHIKAHVNYTTLPNGTITFGAIPHTGQMFFDQSSLTAINTIYPYALDNNTFTLNADDRVIQDQQNTSYYDAFVEMRSLGYNLTAGLVGFINLAVDPTSTPPAVGGNANGGGSEPGGNGTSPSGSISGSPPSTT